MHSGAFQFGSVIELACALLYVAAEFERWHSTSCGLSRLLACRDATIDTSWSRRIDTESTGSHCSCTSSVGRVLLVICEL